MTFIELMDRYGVPYKTSGHHHCTVGWVSMDCPDCSPNWQHMRLGYNLQFGYFNCWACGPKRTYDTFRNLLPQEVDVKALMAELSCSSFQEVKEVPRGIYLPPKGLTKLMPQHRNYLEKRGFDPDELEKTWDIKGIGLVAAYQWRVFIPIYHKREPVSWTTRSLSDEVKTKYLSASPQQEKVDNHSILYGEDFCTNAVVITEGPFDAWKIGPGAVATLGLGYSLRQLARMAKFSVRAVCLDNDRAGRRRSKDLVDILSCLPGTTYAITLDSKDAGSATPREIARIRSRVLS
jgi:hypothetical protein